jgi:ABC-type sulfate transport system permease component
MIAPIRFLNSPQTPNTSYLSALKSSVYTSVFVAVFLAVFQPFGLHSVEGPWRLLVIASFGLPCLLPDLLIGCSLVYWFGHSNAGERWKVWHELLVTLLYLFAIGASNYAYD